MPRFIIVGYVPQILWIGRAFFASPPMHGNPNMSILNSVKIWFESFYAPTSTKQNRYFDNNKLYSPYNDKISEACRSI